MHVQCALALAGKTCGTRGHAGASKQKRLAAELQACVGPCRKSYEEEQQEQDEEAEEAREDEA